MTADTPKHTEELERRLEAVEQKLQLQQKLLNYSLVGLVIVGLAMLIPGVGHIIGLILFAAAILFGMLLFISVLMGILERFSPSGRMPPPDDSLPRIG